jgi:hypothetical protein
MSSVLKVDNTSENKASMNDEFITAKDLKIAFLEFTRDELNPRFTEIDNKFNDIYKILTTLKMQMYGLMASFTVIFGTLGFIVNKLFEISAHFPK